MRCLETMKITEILRLREMGFKLREISDAVGCSKTTVGEILTRCKACDLRYEDAIILPQGRLNELIYPESFGRKQVKEEPDWEAMFWMDIFHPKHFLWSGNGLNFTKKTSFIFGVPRNSMRSVH